MEARRSGVHHAKMGRSVHAGKPKGQPRLGWEAPAARPIREGRLASTATVHSITECSRSDNTRASVLGHESSASTMVYQCPYLRPE